MNFGRVKILFWRYAYATLRDFGMLFALFYWPLLDVVLWGLNARWAGSYTQEVPVAFILVSSAMVWWLVARCADSIGLCLLEELWSRNVVNLFASPLTKNEWLCAAMCVGVSKALATCVIAATAAWLLYGIALTKLGWALCIIVPGLIASGLVISLFICSMLIHFGKKVETFVWISSFLFAPFCAVYYPLSVMPLWVQYISKLFPMTYLFEILREAAQGMPLSPSTILTSYGLIVFYALIAYKVFAVMFEKSRDKGFARL